MNLSKISFAFLLLVSAANAAIAQGTRLLRHPTISRDSVAFEYAGDLWVVSRSGGTARRLTSTPSLEIDPYFSPDGSQIAFTATVEVVRTQSPSCSCLTTRYKIFPGPIATTLVRCGSAIRFIFFQIVVTPLIYLPTDLIRNN